MKDLHCHIIYGVDDGSKNIDESIKLLKEEYNNGFDEIVLTPHYIYNTKYNCNNKNKKELLNILKKEIKKNKLNIKLYLGNEVYLTDNIVELINKNEISTINNSKYILVEFSLTNLIKNYRDILYNLIIDGYIPIIAHPERYTFINDNLIKELLDLGVLFQVNYSSLYGKYGFKAKLLSRKYIKKGYISFIGSDTHHDVYKTLKLEKKLLKLLKDQNKVNDILYNNFNKVIKNKNI